MSKLLFGSVLLVNSFLLFLVLDLSTVAQRWPSIPWNWQRPFQHERGKYFEGDIILGFMRAGSNAPLWENAIVPYYLHPSISVAGRQAIFTAMNDIQSKTCIKFKFRRYEKDYVGITNFNQGCFSYVGRSRGKQQLNLGPGCWHKTTIIHELVHAIGFWHEQSRMDRDKYIAVQWNNIPRQFWREFQKYKNLDNFGTTYDLRSVMHYSYNAFARDRRRPTIRTRQPYPLRLLGTGDDAGGLTEIDAYQINKMYNCPIAEDKRKRFRG